MFLILLVSHAIVAVNNCEKKIRLQSLIISLTAIVYLNIMHPFSCETNKNKPLLLLWNRTLCMCAHVHMCTCAQFCNYVQAT